MPGQGIEPRPAACQADVTTATLPRLSETNTHEHHKITKDTHRHLVKEKNYTIEIKITKDSVKVLARGDIWLKRKISEAIEIKIGQPVMNREITIIHSPTPQGYELPPSTTNFCCHVIVVNAIT